MGLIQDLCQDGNEESIKHLLTILFIIIFTHTLAIDRAIDMTLYKLM